MQEAHARQGRMPTSVAGVVLLAIFIVPGFIFQAVLNRNILGKPTSDFRSLVQALVWSLIIHTAFLPWSSDAYRAWEARALVSQAKDFWLKGIIVIILAPAVGALILGKVLEWSRAQRLLTVLGLSWEERLPLCWDWLANRKQGYWVILEFKDGRRIGGKFDGASAMSMTSWLPHAPRDIFIEQICQLKDNSDEIGLEVPYSQGAWVNGEELRSIKLFREAQQLGGKANPKLERSK